MRRSKQNLPVRAIEFAKIGDQRVHGQEQRLVAVLQVLHEQIPQHSVASREICEAMSEAHTNLLLHNSNHRQQTTYLGLVSIPGYVEQMKNGWNASGLGYE